MLDPDNDERYKCCANCKHWARLAPPINPTGFAHAPATRICAPCIAAKTNAASS